MKTITLQVSDEVHALLTTLTDEFRPDVEAVIDDLIDHAQQGVYRPGAWERGWLCQAFGEDFIAKLERNPDAPCFDRPKVLESPDGQAR